MELRRGAYSSGRGLGGAVGSHAWLSACVRHIVTTAGATEQPGSQAGGAAAGSGAASSAGGGRGASLHLVFSGPSGHSHSFQTLPLSRTVADNPQVRAWRCWGRAGRRLGVVVSLRQPCL